MILKNYILNLCCKDLELSTLSCFHLDVLKSIKMYIIPMFDNYPTFFKMLEFKYSQNIS